MLMPVPTRRTTLDIGTAFEKHALRFLNEGLYMDLRRVGGAGDGGVDLRGWWWVLAGQLNISSSSKGPETLKGGAAAVAPRSGPGPGPTMQRLRVVAQCKAERKALGPRAIREMEGVISQLAYRHKQARTIAPPTSVKSENVANEDVSPNDTDSTIALLISQSGFSKNAMVHATQSSAPLMLVHLEGGHPFSSANSNEEQSNHIGDPSGASEDDVPRPESVWWNRALSEGVFAGRLELRREVVLSLSPGAGVGRRISLWIDGKRIRRLNSPATESP